MATQDILMPGGSRVGKPGTSPEIRVLPGGQREAEDFFDVLRKGGVPDPNSTHPRLFQLPGGGTIGYRPISKKNGPPTIDVDILGIPIRKIKFV
jgi:hypothetical protein